ncbi:TIGR04283 family arsenosugar biosynthesis glycosyltransferase [Planktothrix sp. FACHB-1355]|uniref:4,4'-diaponeurosporenoate glycosyltransferase n=1 Tax=Aerosakkonema funiforme FACHB-1375 TaxID=2949571 RepID=A0A926ZI03_9CYAN|nr:MULTISPECIES: TIGR04283 family arsenosugar biosynthesis glycosyltransferase [Oscillatoriales]MBD2183878.1 TIGR04283 family arsenosugar biosynthesis glycosyltransferase [Aerosakkonema funiforme FACHB-1375]MBD3560415.1 TIGR04283 family arsenosugar biosynthesis glycosyltransferase [Planktothrix sp. FACHB-1355]
MQTHKISIIIPVLNEAQNITKSVLLAQNATNVEVIVVDGGSQDETVAIAKSLGVKVLSSPPGRAFQMNAGAAVASGNILLFLHADTILPEGFDSIIRQTLEPKKQIQNPIAGAFELKIDAQIRGIRLVEKMVNWRSHIFSLPYGDQAIFIKADVFRDIGGFPELPIMEDFVFIRNVNKVGKIAIAPVPVITSGRRWQKLGVLKTTSINQIIIIAYFLGISPQKLARFYRRK